MPSTSHSGLRSTAKNSFQPRTTIAATAHSGGMRLLAALFASCVAIAWKQAQWAAQHTFPLPGCASSDLGRKLLLTRSMWQKQVCCHPIYPASRVHVELCTKLLKYLLHDEARVGGELTPESTALPWWQQHRRLRHLQFKIVTNVTRRVGRPNDSTSWLVHQENIGGIGYCLPQM